MIERPRWSASVGLLSRAIGKHPDAPVNYLLRGEAWLALDQTDRARADFETARRLAEGLLTQSAWGYIYQAYIDRADAGLRSVGSFEERYDGNDSH